MFFVYKLTKRQSSLGDHTFVGEKCESIVKARFARGVLEAMAEFVVLSSVDNFVCSMRESAAYLSSYRDFASLL